MNYLRAYCNLIRKAENRVPPEGYVEGHHVFPKSLYGENKRIVKLTAREHYIAHALLEKALIKRYGNKDIRSIKMTYAFSFMNNHTNQNDYCNSYLYEGCRIRYAMMSSILMKEYYKDNISQNKGIPLTEEHKQNISNALKGRKFSPETIEKMRKNNLGKKHTEEAKEKIRQARAKQVFTEETTRKRSEAYKNKVWMHDPIKEQSYRINKDDVNDKLSSGLFLGRFNYLKEDTRMKLSIAAKKQWERQRNK
jgi:hypothetical protein